MTGYWTTMQQAYKSTDDGYGGWPSNNHHSLLLLVVVFVGELFFVFSLNNHNHHPCSKLILMMIKTVKKFVCFVRFFSFFASSIHFDFILQTHSTEHWQYNQNDNNKTSQQKAWARAFSCLVSCSFFLFPSPLTLLVCCL